MMLSRRLLKIIDLRLIVSTLVILVPTIVSAEPSAEDALQLLRAYDEEFLSSYTVCFREDFPRATASIFQDRATWTATAYGQSGKHILIDKRPSAVLGHQEISKEIVTGDEWFDHSKNPSERVAVSPIGLYMLIENDRIVSVNGFETVVASGRNGRIVSASGEQETSMLQEVLPYDENHEQLYFDFIRTLGRGYTWLLGDAVSCTVDSDGIMTLDVLTAEHAQTWTTHWQLTIDTQNAYLVTNATSWYEAKTVQEFSSDGKVWQGQKVLPLLEKGTYTRTHHGKRGMPRNVMLDSYSRDVDANVFSNHVNKILGIGQSGTMVIDRTKVDTSGNAFVFKLE